MTNPPTPSETAQRPPRNTPTPPAGETHRGRGRRPGVPTKIRAEIPADELVIVQLGDKASADLRRKKEERTPQQKQVDTIVYDVFRENLRAGWDHGTIQDWADLFVYDWPVTKTHFETAMFYLDKAGRLYHRHVLIGEKVEIGTQPHDVEDPVNEGKMIPCHLNGREHVHIPFTVVRKQKRTRASS